MHKVDMFFGENMVCPFLDKETYTALKNEKLGCRVSVVTTPPMENGKASIPSESSIISVIQGKFSDSDFLRQIAVSDTCYNHITHHLLSIPVVDGEYTVSIVYKYHPHTEDNNTTIILELSCVLDSEDLLAFKSGLCELHIIGTMTVYEAIKESLDVNGARHSS